MNTRMFLIKYRDGSEREEYSDAIDEADMINRVFGMTVEAAEEFGVGVTILDRPTHNTAVVEEPINQEASTETTTDPDTSIVAPDDTATTHGTFGASETSEGAAAT